MSSGIINNSGPWRRPAPDTHSLDQPEPTLASMSQAQPSRRAHAKMLRRYGKLNTFVKCPGCRQRGGLYYLYHPEQHDGQKRWCYLCGWCEIQNDPDKE